MDLSSPLISFIRILPNFALAYGIRPIDKKIEEQKGELEFPRMVQLMVMLQTMAEIPNRERPFLEEEKIVKTIIEEIREKSCDIQNAKYGLSKLADRIAGSSSPEQISQKEINDLGVYSDSILNHIEGIWG